MAASRVTRRRQGSLPKSESPDNDNDGDNVNDKIYVDNDAFVKKSCKNRKGQG